MRAAAAVIALLITAAPLSGQSPTRQVPGTIRSGIAVVPVDVRVLDRDGKPITDLKQDDFTLFEDGVPQSILQFASQALTPQEPVADVRPAMRRNTPPAASAAASAPPKHRTFLIVLGRGRLQHPAKGVDAMIRFVRERLLPQDQVAVLAYNRATDFTTSHESVALVLERFKAGHESIESKLFHRQAGLTGLYGDKAFAPKIQTLIDDIFSAPGAPEFRTVPPGRVTDSGRIADDSRQRADAMLQGDLADSGARGDDGMSLDDFIGTNAQTTTDLENLYTGIEYLRYIEGEKRLLFVTERGLFLPRQEDDMSLGAIANDARVVLDTIRTGGVGGGPPPSRNNPAPLPGPNWAERFAAMSLRTLSEVTGGHSSLYAYADKAAQKIDESSRFTYLLGYSSTNGDLNGRYRRITVKVNRPGAIVHYRQGYYGRAQLVPFDRREFLTYSRVLAAAMYPNQIYDIRLGLKTRLVKGESDRSDLVAEIKIDLKRVKFTEKDGWQTAQLDLSIYTTNADGRGVGEMYRKFNLALSPEEYQKALKDGVSYTMRLATRGAVRWAKVVVYDYDGDVIGTIDTRVY